MMGREGEKWLVDLASMDSLREERGRFVHPEAALFSSPLTLEEEVDDEEKGVEEEFCEELLCLAATTRFPTPVRRGMHRENSQDKIDYIAERIYEIMSCLGLDLDHPSLKKTPQRVAKMYVEELFSGLDLKSFPKVTTFENDLKGEKRSLILVQTRFHSLCEHHLVPMFGTAYIGYLPKKKIIGLSKIPRIVRYFSRRPQLQERLTAQIVDSLSILLETEHVAAVLKAAHLCMMARGVQESEGITTTHLLRGDFQEDACLRAQFLASVGQ